jgi:hypothetical protein
MSGCADPSVVRVLPRPPGVASQAGLGIEPAFREHLPLSDGRPAHDQLDRAASRWRMPNVKPGENLSSTEGRPCDGPVSWGIRTDVTYRSLTSPARARHSKPSLPGPASNQPPPHAIEHTMRGTSGWACAVAGWRSHQALRGLEQLPTARFLRMRASSTTHREAYIQERRMKNPASILTGLNATQYTTLMRDTLSEAGQ